MRKSRIFLVGSAGVIGLVIAVVATLSSGPDFDMRLERDIPSKLSPHYLDQVFASVPTWPLWFHNGSSAVRVNSQGVALPPSAQKVEKDAIIQLTIRSKSGLSKPLEITLQVLDYVPEKKLSLRVLADSKNRLTTLFDRLDWSIELSPASKGSQIRGIVTAHSHHWRSRFYGRIASHILLNQAFSPDLFILSEINNPTVVVPNPDTQHM